MSVSMITEPAVTPEQVKKHGLTPEEYERIKNILGREPNFTELGIFSVMWSEHCSYKNTRPLLKGFPTKSPRILVGAGEENAGIMPHPERACEALLGSADGRLIFESLVRSVTVKKAA